MLAFTALALSAAWLLGRFLGLQWLRLHASLTAPDPACTTPYCDHTMFWLAGSLVRHGQAATLYHYAAYAQAGAKILPFKTGFWPFIYPPTILPYAWAVSFMPLAASYYIATLGLLAAAIALLRKAGLPWWCILLGLLSPEAMWCLYLGQLGLLCGALLITGAALLPCRPALAGALFGLLAIKPQYAILVPMIVLATRQWRALPTGALTVAALLVISYFMAGTEVWPAYLTLGRAAAKSLLEAPFGYQAMGLSPFWMLRSLGAGLPLAYSAQLLASLTAAGLTWASWHQNHPHRLALTMCFTLLASPYGFTDDLAATAILLPTLDTGPGWRRVGLAALWLAPAYTMHFVHSFGWLPAPILLAAATALAWQTPSAPAAHTIVRAQSPATPARQSAATATQAPPPPPAPHWPPAATPESP